MASDRRAEDSLGGHKARALKASVWAALGAASMAWETPEGAGATRTEEIDKVGEALWEDLQQALSAAWIRGHEAGYSDRASRPFPTLDHFGRKD